MLLVLLHSGTPLPRVFESPHGFHAEQNDVVLLSWLKFTSISLCDQMHQNVGDLPLKSFNTPCGSIYYLRVHAASGKLCVSASTFSHLYSGLVALSSRH